ncbi:MULTISPECIES: hypothetical protein [unclassified Streptomyces]|uniref:hypothetical protein n=1 Tax=unclassified Streptomyces TaxID=2593676 RepID=UPI002E1A8A3E|nr:hypothetical protein OG217_04085 [Streptomyces sp. NBC_01023]
MTRENRQAALPDGTENREFPEGTGTQGRPPRRRGLTADTLGLFRGNWHGLYGFSFGVALLAALVGSALVAAAFALSWHNFALTWKFARSDIAYEDPPVGYFPEQYTSIFLRSLPFMGLLLLFAFFALALLHIANAVAVRDAEADGRHLGPGELWRRSRPYLWLAFRVQLLTLLCTVPLALLAYFVAGFFRHGGMMGIEFEPLDYWSSTRYRLLANGLTSVVVIVALFVWLRLSLATAAAANGASTARAAVRRSWSLTGGARRRRALPVCALLTAAAVAAYLALSYAAEPLAHPVGLAVLWLTNDNPYAAGSVMEIVPAAVSLLLLTALVVPPVSAALALLRTELSPAQAGKPE